MKLAEIPAREAERLADLHSLDMLDTEPEPRFEAIVDLAQAVFDVPRVFISLVDTDRMWWKAKRGVGDLPEAPRDIGFCSHSINEGDCMVVEDATKDDRFADNPFVTGEFNLRFYAGSRMYGPAGEPIASFAIVDTEPRQFSERDRDLLTRFARLVEIELAC
jgi:GAF domain-containing protein